MNTETITRIEQGIQRLEIDRSKAIEANDAAIELEENRKSGHTDIQAANVQQLKTKKDSIVQVYDSIRERKAVELAKARTEMATRQARENSENEAQAAKLKATALRAFIAAGGSAADFDEHYKQIVISRTVERMNQEENRFVLPRI